MRGQEDNWIDRRDRERAQHDKEKRPLAQELGDKHPPWCGQVWLADGQHQVGGNAVEDRCEDGKHEESVECLLTEVGEGGVQVARWRYVPYVPHVEKHLEWADYLCESLNEEGTKGGRHVLKDAIVQRIDGQQLPRSPPHQRHNCRRTAPCGRHKTLDRRPALCLIRLELLIELLHLLRLLRDCHALSLRDRLLLLLLLLWGLIGLGGGLEIARLALRRQDVVRHGLVIGVKVPDGDLFDRRLHREHGCHVTFLLLLLLLVLLVAAAFGFALGGR
mmetsp:Transcript_25164/g.62316  ORF Transcript_25164/g.62316 Transcript_25164/m.62316 type:complete len:275 (-) Transcript_25164:1210-2034(-)